MLHFQNPLLPSPFCRRMAIVAMAERKVLPALPCHVLPPLWSRFLSRLYMRMAIVAMAERKVRPGEKVGALAG